MSLELAQDYMPDIRNYKTIPLPVVRKATIADVRREYELASLDQLTTNHMSQQQKEWFNGLVANVKRWREAVKTTPYESFIISSKEVGIGKTHIAKAIMTTFSSIVGDLEYQDDVPQFKLWKRAKMYTAPELIRQIGIEGMGISTLIPAKVKCIIIDDLGREGYIDYVKADQQANEKRRRYFELINYMYEHRRKARLGYAGRVEREATALFITTNLSTVEIKELMGDAAYSRLLHLCPIGNIYEINGLDDYRRVATGRA